MPGTMFTHAASFSLTMLLASFFPAEILRITNDEIKHFKTSESFKSHDLGDRSNFCYIGKRL
jgi:hypothetical protein